MSPKQPPEAPVPDAADPTGATGNPPALSRAERRAQERQTELAECLTAIADLLAKYDAAFDVRQTCTWTNGVPRFTHDVVVVSKS